MKSILIEVNTSAIECTPNHTSNICPYLWHITIPILPALSVEYFSAQMGPHSSLSFSSEGDRIEGDKIILASNGEISQFRDQFQKIGVICYYHGIRDYGALFPWISNQNLRNRLGQFYEEAERNFDQGAWLSFALMCGAVFEGMLYSKLNMPVDNQFQNMINLSCERDILAQDQRDIMNKVRQLRNLVHANRFSTPYITRKDAMDIRNTLDQLIKNFSF